MYSTKGLMRKDTIRRLVREWGSLPVESTAIASLCYLSPERILVVEFNRGARYAFYDVTPQKWGHFKRAESKGRFFAYHVRGQYESKLL